MTCKLCLQDKDLIRKSHIFSEFLYRDMYNDKHQIIEYENFEADKGKIRQKGIYESNILCAECETSILSPLESCGRKTLYGDQLLPLSYVGSKSMDGIIQYDFENIPYKKFKLFLLSIIWRASISSKPFFSEVNLGPHEEVMRNLIYNNLHCPDNQYKVTILNTAEGDKKIKGVLSGVRKLKVQGGTLYSFFIQGLIFIYVISANINIEMFNMCNLKSDGKMKIVKYPRDLTDSWLSNYFGLPNVSSLLDFDDSDLH